jgi:hypothetical protein
MNMIIKALILSLLLGVSVEQTRAAKEKAASLVSKEKTARQVCIIASAANKDAALVLGEWGKTSQAWVPDGGLFRTTLNQTMCMQAGRGGTPTGGTKLRIFPCDVDNKYQQFAYNNDTIKLKDTNYCVVFRGVNANVNDPIILKSCDKSGTQDSWKAIPV